MAVRIGVIGTGNIGSQHINLLKGGAAPAARLAATASRSPPENATGVPHYADYREMLASGNLDAVLVATPTMMHQEMAEAVLGQGLHLLMEKPLAMSVGQAQSLLKESLLKESLLKESLLNMCMLDKPKLNKPALKKPTQNNSSLKMPSAEETISEKSIDDMPIEGKPYTGKPAPDEPADCLQFAVMLNQRFHPVYRQLKQLLAEGYIGELMRVNWTMTAWYRPDIYYQVSSWRGTWQGEGGGLLINQCIHNLDILQWLLGLPVSVTARVGFGKYHDIDVEDEAYAILGFENGAMGTLIASSGEAPGVNRLELVGDKGRLIAEDSTIHGMRSAESLLHHCKNTREMFGSPEFTSEVIAPGDEVNQHAAVIQNFAEAIEGQAQLLTPAEEGLGSLQLANGILLSAWQGRAVTLPIDAVEYERALQEKIKGSAMREAADVEVEIDMGKSYR